MQTDTQMPRDCLRLAREGWLARWKRKANCVPVTESALPPSQEDGVCNSPSKGDLVYRLILCHPI